MSENENLPMTRQARAVQGRSTKGHITGKLKVALDLMVHRGLTRDEAATEAGLTPHGLYSALRKPHVKAAYLAECEVLRVSGRARRIHRLEALTEQDENKQAAVNAARALDLMGDDTAATAGIGHRPGLVIVVVNQAGAEQRLAPPDSPGPGMVINHRVETNDDGADR